MADSSRNRDHEREDVPRRRKRNDTSKRKDGRESNGSQGGERKPDNRRGRKPQNNKQPVAKEGLAPDDMARHLEEHVQLLVGLLESSLARLKTIDPRAYKGQMSKLAQIANVEPAQSMVKTNDTKKPKPKQKAKVKRIVLVCGATGNVGGATAQSLLLDAGVSVRVLVRDASAPKAVKLKEAGAELCVGDYGEPETVAAALDGAQCCFLACGNVKEQVAFETAVIDAAEASPSCYYLVKLSTCGVLDKNGVDYCSEESPIGYGKFHAAIEARLQKCGENLKWTVLRPNNFMQNHVGDIFGTLPNKVVVYPHAKAGAAIIDVRDVGSIAGKLLARHHQSDFFGKKFNLSGPKAWTIKELAELYSSVLGKEIGVVTCDPKDFQKGLEGAGFASWLAECVTCNHTNFWAEGVLDYPTDPELLKLTKHNLRTMEAWVAEMAPLVSFNE